jgi:ABC-type multidrug transport system fused ATPase/permease subunit
VILVSHRVAAVKDADQIIVLAGGKIAERGTHAELLARKSSTYAELYKKQLDHDLIAHDPPQEASV